MKKPAKAAEPDAVQPALIVFGVDDSKRPHAAWFGEADAEVAKRAAGLMAMSMVKITGDEHRAVASELPAGRVFASGRGFVPFCAKGTYDRLTAFEGAFKPEAPALAIELPPEPKNIPASWKDIQLHSLVLACDPAEGAWFEAVVVEVKGDLCGLRWCKWPELPDFVRRNEHLALMSATAYNAVGEASALPNTGSVSS